jgi:hypothetical protein
LDILGAFELLNKNYPLVKLHEDVIEVYDIENSEEIVEFLLKNGHNVVEVKKNKVGLEEYYIELMSKKEVV